MQDLCQIYCPCCSFGMRGNAFYPRRAGCCGVSCCLCVLCGDAIDAFCVLLYWQTTKSQTTGIYEYAATKNRYLTQPALYTGTLAEGALFTMSRLFPQFLVSL